MKNENCRIKMNRATCVENSKWLSAENILKIQKKFCELQINEVLIWKI